jgi:uncharacterized protein YjdB
MGNIMNRRLLGLAATVFAFCSTLSCSDRSSEINGIAPNDSAVQEARALAAAVNPGTVTDLQAAVTGSTSVTLSFTQVNDGTGQPAKYNVRYAVAPISWGSATSTTNGTCATPVAGTATGSQLSCTVLGLTPATNYGFQLVAFRGTMNLNAVYGPLSNTVSATTTASEPPPAAPVATVSVSPASSSLLIGATVQLSGVTRDSSNNVLTGRAITWSSSNSAISRVSTSGLVTAVVTGSATITATSETKTGTAAITVSAPPPAPVATVSVSPVSSTLLVGATVQLSATTRDASNNVLTGRVVTWASANPGIASVSSTGLVRGVGAGSTTVTATSETKTGTASENVQAPPPPPPPGGTLLFQENFENNSLASRGWYDNTSVLLSTTEHIAGSVSSAQYRFLAGAKTPTTGGAQRHKFTPSNSLYVSYYVKYSANWVGSTKAYHPHEFYVMSTLDGDWGGPAFAYMTLYLEHSYQNGGKPVMMMQDNNSINTTSGALPNNLVGTTENRSTAGCNGLAESNMSISTCYNQPPWANAKGIMGPVVFQPNPGPGYKNDWNFVEAYYQLNTIVNGIGQADGVMQYWFNGALIIDRHDILYRTGVHPTLQFSQFLIAPYIGDGSPVDQSMWVDNLRVATARIP